MKDQEKNKIGRLCIYCQTNQKSTGNHSGQYGGGTYLQICNDCYSEQEKNNEEWNEEGELRIASNY